MPFIIVIIILILLLSSPIAMGVSVGSQMFCAGAAGRVFFLQHLSGSHTRPAVCLSIRGGGRGRGATMVSTPGKLLHTEATPHQTPRGTPVFRGAQATSF